MRKHISAIVFLLLFSQIASAVVAISQKFNYTQPDGTVVTLQLHGDEFFHWVTLNGNPVILGEDGYYHPESQASLSMRREQGNAARMQREMQLQRSAISEGSHRFLVLLVEFSDLRFTIDNPKQAFSNLLNQEGYSVNGGTGSVRDYYIENSRGKFLPDYDVVGPVTLDYGFATYGGNDSSGNDADPQRALYEACLKADPYVDFSEYDIDKDGYVDNVFFFYAGHNEAEGADASTIWPHKWSVYKYDCRCDGVRIYNYACSSEYKGRSGSNMCGIGTFCHEFGHVIGLPDLYDTDYATGGYADDMENYTLMSSGNYNNAGRTPPYLTGIERTRLGWMDGPVEWNESGQKTVEGVQNNVSYYTRTGTDGEIFIYETRTGTGWDSYLEPGLAIYHLDRSNRRVGSSTAKNLWESGQKINALASHPCYYVVKSSYNTPYTFGTKSSTSQFTSTSNPGSIGWDGNPTGYNLTNISFANGVTTLRLRIDRELNILGTVRSSNGLVLQGVAISIVPKSAMAQASGNADVLKAAKYGTVTDKDGKYQIEIDDVDETGYYIVASKEGYISQSVEIMPESESIVADFVLYATLEAPKNTLLELGFRYIRNEKNEWTTGDDFVLALEEGPVKPESVVWYYDGKKTSNAKVRLTFGTHTVKAVVTNYDGTTEELELVMEVGR